MANPTIIEKKAQQTAEIADKIRKAQSVIIFDYCGLTVEQVTALRCEMRKANVEYVVLKNTMVARAATAAGIDASILPILNGPSAFAFGYDDPVAPAKILKESIKKYKKCSFKGSIVDGAVMNADATDKLADLPSREQMLSRVLGSLMSPVTKLAVVLDQLAKKMNESVSAQ